jgi:aryl-alcohol dehydrogenase-like predicted oxidoreductase
VTPSLRRLGNSGLAVSTTGLGCNNLGRPGTLTNEPAAATELVNAAIDAGVTLFDTADIYGTPHGRSEELLGAALGSRRDEVVVATKFGMDMNGANGPDFGARGSRRYIRTAVEASLRRLGTDRIDLYQMHEPDPETPIEETLATLSDLVREGKVRYIGNSNFAGWQLADADWTATVGNYVPFIAAQNEYSLLRRDIEAEVLPAAAAHGLGVLPFFPLANGLLTGKYRKDAAPAGTRLVDLKPYLLESAPWGVLDGLQALADDRGITMLQLAFGWLLAQPQVTSVIAGATRPDQIRDNADAADAWIPDGDDLAAVGDVLTGTG